jgi:hypothetical protein
LPLQSMAVSVNTLVTSLTLSKKPLLWGVEVCIHRAVAGGQGGPVEVEERDMRRSVKEKNSRSFSVTVLWHLCREAKIGSSRLTVEPSARKAQVERTA